MSTTSEDPVATAVAQALKQMREDAVREVEAILDAALKVAENSRPASPRVADIVAEAGTSNQAFYRYFTGKEDLMQVVMARGLHRLRAYLEHRMSSANEPEAQIERWIRGLLTQATNQTAARQSVAVSEILTGFQSRSDLRAVEATSALRDLLLTPLTELGSSNPRFDAQVIYEASMGTISSHLHADTVPSNDECNHLVAFCLGGLSLRA